MKKRQVVISFQKIGSGSYEMASLKIAKFVAEELGARIVDTPETAIDELSSSGPIGRLFVVSGMWQFCKHRDFVVELCRKAERDGASIYFCCNDYRVKSGYYGGYPAGYLPRVMSMFPDAREILHLFSGCVEKVDGRFTTFDINPERKPDICGDAERLSRYFEPNMRAESYVNGRAFDLILADPPYSVEDCEHYGTPMVSRSKVIKECVKILAPGGVLVWLDQVFPMFRKDELDLVGTIYARADLPEGLEHVGEIGMVKSTNHRVRAVFMFQKTNA